MEILRLDHVQLAIPPGRDAEARAFYAGVLGFTEVPKPEPMRVRGGMWFQAGPIQIHLGIEENMRASVKAHPALVVRDLAAWKQRLVAAGFQWKDADDVPGTTRGHTWDPFGNRIELIEGGT
jgi:catechol 2,3-dioxygenase-like lactoylglutathione lyase family enzyme